MTMNFILLSSCGECRQTRQEWDMYRTYRTGQDVRIMEEVEGDPELAIVQLVMTEVKWGHG